jgi:hypothetical protein
MLAIGADQPRRVGVFAEDAPHPADGERRRRTAVLAIDIQHRVWREAVVVFVDAIEHASAGVE